jgi:signal transduction protein with GAF and PtsI domain
MANATDDDGNRLRIVGTGQSVFEAGPVSGRLVKLEGPDDVLDLLDRGPEGHVVLIRDAGATFLAPLYHDLTAVICTGGTLRSHIGIVTRDFRLPCIMACEFETDPADDQVVEVDCSDTKGVVRG